MKVGIIGGGIAGLSAAYYIKKLALPVSQIVLIESSNRFGGWIRTEKLRTADDRNIVFEAGARIFRYKPLQRRELNTLDLAKDLNLMSEIDFVPNEHPASKYRYVYLNGKFIEMNPNVILKKGNASDELNSATLPYYLYNENKIASRSCEIKDESIYDFIQRRFGTDFAEKVIDPYFKNICSGDIKELSALSLLKSLFASEGKHGSVLKGYVKGRQEDRVRMKERFTNFSVWRFKNGMQTLVDSLVENLKSQDNVQLKTNEKCLNINFKNKHNTVEIKTDKSTYDVDFVISSVYSKYLGNLLSDEHSKFKSLLNKIDAVDMIVVNLYFDKNILPVQGYGYFVPTSENSPILSCLFDSIFDSSDKNYSLVTLMLGGAAYSKYITPELENDPQKLFNFALTEFKKQINLDIEPKNHKVSVLKNCFPQYKVGHQQLLRDIDDYLKTSQLSGKLYPIGSSYNGFGIKDVIYNSKTLCERVLKNRQKSE